MSSSANSSLRPAWHRGSQGGGRGFQPPPQVASERSRSQSTPVADSEKRDSNFNKFAALDDDEELAEKAGDSNAQQNPPNNSRSEALRGKRNSSTGRTGRSLAELAARIPPGSEGERRPSRFSGLRSNSSGDRDQMDGSSRGPDRGAPVETVKVTRFTRERLLSMRPQPQPSPPDHLVKALEGVGSVILSDEPQDPVCWDTFDAEEIWATAPRRASTKIIGVEEPRRLSGGRNVSGGGGRWERGVRIPDAGKKGRERDAEDPSELWDDPFTAEGAAMDFSAFGAMPADDSAGDAFDFDKMTEATKKFEEEMHGSSRSRASSNAESEKSEEDPDDEDIRVAKVNPKRPLATVGTTIRSGSGDDVNVFEDFDDPALEPEQSDPIIKAVDENPDATSRLIDILGVKKEEEPSLHNTDPVAPVAPVESKLSAWGVPEPVVQSSVLGIPLNPWGDPILGGVSNQPSGLDLQARLLEEQKAREEEMRRRQEQEEAERRAMAQQAERERARQASMQQQQQQQQAGVQSQVEIVLMERISTILENSWGRSDLVSILTTLHSEDSRVIPLLNNIDALRALLLRNPQRVALRQDPTIRAEMAALLMTNAQWQQQQAAQQARLLAQQQEELKLREQQRRMEEQQAAARAQQNVSVIPDAPWYYSDPQQNIQGPFRGEEMRQWLEAGYFKGDLPISQQTSGPFRPLSAIFPDLSVAFMPRRSDEDAARAEAEEKARLEAERAEAEAEERERLAREAAEREKEWQAKEAAKREHQARLAAEQERQAREAARREQKAKEDAARAAAQSESNSNGVTESSSAQLKMMLGLNAQAVEPKPEPSAEPQTKAQSGKSNEKKSSKANKNAQAQKKESPSEPAVPVPVQSAKNAPPAWGGAAVSQPVSRKSMSEIQKEEARAAAAVAMRQGGTKPSGSGWANVAASRGGSTAWSGVAQQKPAAVIAKSPTPARAVSLQPSSVAVANAQAAAAQMQQEQRSTSMSGVADSSAAAAEAFGAKMSPALEKWCKEQMQKLNGTDDLTLVSFCMTLSDPVEIRQYLTAYLGSTPQVNNFATEFINKKGGKKDNQDEWESTVPGKKGKKKKAR